ncbi:2Fe-2S iron-sulfur cluster-binding protein [Pseudanabaena sp. ABRG5-3]|jgi:ferredoxin|uniref:2Fe-2S iron-sulfur cluster-binding protein n=1 Tax=Pseudanabaena sp. ABRG5-3 TaxID=685565 RepID=UPI000DC6EFF0|nr:2Fe-2S iron-sulfur cluster-binding protein [Pseudanabaena sp. ABRG5-3]BBC25053.1 ferredoxin 2Fe-2S [Pseudanabaena sp. ABRG5-3]
MTQTFTATLHHQGQTFTVPVPEDQAILDAAIAAGVDLPCSCYAGVCTTCAAQIVKGQVDQSQGMGIGGMGEELDAKGYILLCVSYPKSDVEIYTDKEQEVYSIRFGSGSSS